MLYELPNGKKVKIPDVEIEKSMKALELTKDEAIEMWLEDEGYLDNEFEFDFDEAYPFMDEDDIRVLFKHEIKKHRSR